MISQMSAGVWMGMWRYAFASLLCVGIMGCYSPALPVDDAMFDDPEWVTVFEDEFDGDGLDQSRWTTCYWWDKNGCTNGTTGELNWYQADNVSVTEGKLRLEARRQDIKGSDGKNYSYTSGIVTTGRSHYRTDRPIRFDFLYGRVEVRAKAPAGQGLWPAIWLLPSDHGITPEIDVMEILGHRPNRVEMNYHYTSSFGGAQNDGSFWSGPDNAADWHVFAVEWRPSAIVWLIDGVERWRFSKRRYISDEPMYLLLNLAVGGDWPGAPDEQTSFPSVFEIDYVRIMQPKELVDNST